MCGLWRPPGDSKAEPPAAGLHRVTFKDHCSNELSHLDQVLIAKSIKLIN